MRKRKGNLRQSGQVCAGGVSLAGWSEAASGAGRGSGGPRTGGRQEDWGPALHTRAQQVSETRQHKFGVFRNREKASVCVFGEGGWGTGERERWGSRIGDSWVTGPNPESHG